VDRERHIINTLLSALGNSQDRISGFFESDAEVFHFGSEKLLFTADEFSEEDHFRDHDPEVLGWNIAAATISDLLASGGIPVYYGHTLTVSPSWTQAYINDFGKGLADCLRKADTTFLGGDLGFGPTWRCTGIAIGRAEKSLTRRGAAPGDGLYMTGRAGAGNLEAAMKIYSEKPLIKPFLKKFPVRFPVRLPESELIRKYASCCIDSSDGILRSLHILMEINDTGIEIEHLPYHSQGLLACRMLGFPKEILFMAECGEYELVFTVPAIRDKEFTEEIKSREFEISRIGIITSDKRLIDRSEEPVTDFTECRFFARDYENVSKYQDDLIHYLKDAKSKR